MLGVEARKPDSLVRPRQLGRALLGESEELPGVACVEIVALAGCLQPLDGELADRLEHPEALAGVPEEALVDERLEGVEVGAGDLLGCLEGAAAAEDGQPGEQALLLVARAGRGSTRSSRAASAGAGRRRVRP